MSIKNSMTRKNVQKLQKNTILDKQNPGKFITSSCDLLKRTMQRNRGKRQNGKDQRSQENSDTKGTFHAKMGTIKVRNGVYLTEAEDIKKRQQEYTEELYKKVLMTQITTML